MFNYIQVFSDFLTFIKQKKLWDILDQFLRLENI